MGNLEKLLVEGRVVEITRRVASTPDRSYVEKDGYYEKSYRVRISSVEDLGDRYYVGYTPVDIRNGGFGYFGMGKNSTKKFGVVAVREV